MTAKLLRCTSLWGTSDWIAAPPAQRRLAEVTYLPWSAAGPWGLFAASRRFGEHGRDAASSDIDRCRTEPLHHGPFLYVGALAVHYGHFLVHTLPRLWPLASWTGPPPRILCHPSGPLRSWEGLEFLVAILERLGRKPEDIVAFDQPVRVDDVIVPEPGLIEQTSIHAAFAGLCREIGRPLWQGTAVDAVARPLYLSKTRLRSGVAHVVNEEAIVQELERRGVEIVFPETLHFADQVRLLSERRVVMGTLGSAFHTTAFAAPGRRLVGLNFQQAINANFALLDRVNGAKARYYHPYGTHYEEAPDWHVAWRVPDPRGTAEALLRRAEWLARDEPDDGGLLGEVKRRALRLFRGR